MSKDVILTGLRANNDLHIGNYLGALLPIVDMANRHAGKYQINLFVPDLHSFTTPIDHTLLNSQIMQNIKVFVAAGLNLDNSDIYIYRQSYIPAHCELTIILNAFTGMGEMSRMTQFKDKSTGLGDERVSVGLFDYPVLMAADILLYGATYVPVGDDQTQHLEFTRDIAERMNAKFGNLFIVPKPAQEQHKFFSALHSPGKAGTTEGGKDHPSPRLRTTSQGLRIRDLMDPTKKMSKSDDIGKGVIFLNDKPHDAMKKIMSAATDSFGDVQYDYKERPGVSNLLDILTLFGGKPDDFIGQKQYGPLKEAVAKLVVDFLENFQATLDSASDKSLIDKLVSSESAMNIKAQATLLKVQSAIGLR